LYASVGFELCGRYDDGELSCDERRRRSKLLVRRDRSGSADDYVSDEYHDGGDFTGGCGRDLSRADGDGNVPDGVV
jgi:hypothetical protein